MCRGEKRALDYTSVPFEMVIIAMEGITNSGASRDSWEAASKAMHCKSLG